MKTISGQVRLTIIRTLKFEFEVEDIVTPQVLERAFRNVVDYDPSDVDVVEEYSVLCEIDKEMDHCLEEEGDATIEVDDDSIVDVEVKFDGEEGE